MTEIDTVEEVKEDKSKKDEKKYAKT